MVTDGNAVVVSISQLCVRLSRPTALRDGIDHAVLRVENIEEDHAHCGVGDDIRDHVCRTDKFPAARLLYSTSARITPMET